MGGGLGFGLASSDGRPFLRFEGGVYDGLSAGERAALEPLVDEIVALERKSALMAAGGLNEMLAATVEELQAHLQSFRARRRAAEAEARDGGEGLAGGKAQADAKAAIEAISLIVRTLEKIDALQRTMADGRVAEEDIDAAAEAAALEKIRTLVERRIADGAGGGLAKASDAGAGDAWLVPAPDDGGG
ncbi:hypothetical protein SAMN05880582_10774 [Rhizobium sp. RU20A]|uniref:hypothetical protein n=1 Tax=Rhizobium sp. RU20A TaxID=1907412 RepID=UPI000956C493|nr:hypothetical protein [Rhizobium sp. RU20A]SIR16137.1 hypothetical protein SAMN05880582_10774 [Rhizobium sp. RU20A]